MRRRFCRSCHGVNGVHSWYCCFAGPLGWAGKDYEDGDGDSGGDVGGNGDAGTDADEDGVPRQPNPGGAHAQLPPPEHVDILPIEPKEVEHRQMLTLPDLTKERDDASTPSRS